MIYYECCNYGRVLESKEVYPRRNMSILTVTLVDGTGAVHLVYFNQPWKKEQFVQGEYILAYGKIEYNNRNGAVLSLKCVRNKENINY